MRNKKARRYSYSDQKNQQHRKRWVVLAVLGFFLLYFSFSALVLSVRVLESNTMMPNLRAGDRFIFSSYAVFSIIPGLGMERETLPFRRGDVVLAYAYRGEGPGFFHHVLYAGVRFLTAQRVGIPGQSGRRSADYQFVRRVIGLPGDEISMDNFVVRVRVRGSDFSLTEFEVTERNYTTNIPQMPPLWDVSLPFSGNMDAIILGENEVFLLSDDRSSTNDSRTWGPVPVHNIRGRAIFRYWPLTRLGRP
ncbi:MAG: signal peptidase I [Treponema sp.]|nr:signal peptidase I [Treponema sp.]